ncbi:MAG: hypothetical protein Q9200_006558 [Gallowayella weberi]
MTSSPSYFAIEYSNDDMMNDNNNGDNVNDVDMDGNDNSVKMDSTDNSVKMDSTDNSVKMDSTDNSVKMDSTDNDVKMNSNDNDVSMAINDNDNDHRPNLGPIEVNDDTVVLNPNYSLIQPEGTGPGLWEDCRDPNPIYKVRKINCRFRIPGTELMEHRKDGKTKVYGGPDDPIFKVKRINCRYRIPGTKLMEHWRDGEKSIGGLGWKPWLTPRRVGKKSRPLPLPTDLKFFDFIHSREMFGSIAD